MIASYAHQSHRFIISKKVVYLHKAANTFGFHLFYHQSRISITPWEHCCRRLLLLSHDISYKKTFVSHVAWTVVKLTWLTMHLKHFIFLITLIITCVIKLCIKFQKLLFAISAIKIYLPTMRYSLNTNILNNSD